jgi:hypothetical protein
MKGITHVPRPYVTGISIEEKYSNMVGHAPWRHNENFTDLYYEQTVVTAKEKPLRWLMLTIDVSLRCLLPEGAAAKGNCVPPTVKQVHEILKSYKLLYKLVHSEQELTNFLLAEDKVSAFAELPTSAHIHGGAASHFGKGTGGGDLDDYAYDVGNQSIVSIPHTIPASFQYFNVGQPNPKFTACVFMYCPGAAAKDSAYTYLEVDEASFAAEIIFMNGNIPGQTMYFTIGDSYAHEGKVSPLSSGLGPQVKSLYGSPGEIWCGPIHRQMIDGQATWMAGAKHSPYAHPILREHMRANTKVVDNRLIGEIEKMFSYNSSDYEDLLNTETQATWLGKNGHLGNGATTIDGLDKNPAIISEVDYSVKKVITPGSHVGGQTKGMVNLLFAVDKLKLLKTTSLLAPMLDRMTQINSTAISFFMDRLIIDTFEISRINTHTRAKEILLVSDNADFASDADQVNSVGNSVSKG